jgi:hypothetical protein
MSEKLLVVHHNDADGRCAAAIVLQAFPEREADLWEADYKDAKDEGWLVRLLLAARGCSEAWVVDFSLPPDAMRRLRENIPRVVWIDHHATAKDYPYQDLPGLRGFTNKGPSGAELAWKYLRPNERTPRVVAYIGDYDSWRLAMPGSTPLRVALEADTFTRDPRSAWWRRALANDQNADNLVAQRVEEGVTMMRFRDGLADSINTRWGFDTAFEGLRCRAVNLYAIGSAAIGNDAALRCYDAGLAFVYDGRQWTVSLYSVQPEVDCGAVCRKYGGGGHKGAAGFVCKELPFKPVGPEGGAER